MSSNAKVTKAEMHGHSGNAYSCDPPPAGWNCLVPPFLTRTLTSFEKKHKEYEAYKASLPFKTVVPEPPHTLREYIAALTWWGLEKAAYYLFLLICAPVLFTAHVGLLLWDKTQRRIWRDHHNNWPFESVPHVRPVSYPTQPQEAIDPAKEGPSNQVLGAVKDFVTGGFNPIYENYTGAAKEGQTTLPLAGWHLRCEDGRQRWIYGAPLAEEEEGNLLGRAKAAGFTNVDDFLLLLQSQAEEDTKVIYPDQEVLEPMWKRRRWLELHQLGLLPKEQRKEPEDFAPGKPSLNTETAMKDGVEFLLKLQDPFSGHWPNDYSGCMFLTPGLVFAEYIVQGGNTEAMFECGETHCHVKNKHNYYQTLNQENVFFNCREGETNVEKQHHSKHFEKVHCQCGAATRQELIRYLRNYQNKDGGWGQHTEGHSTMLGTALNYVAMRLLGVPATDAQLSQARSWIHAHGGAVYTPFWGKYWLTLLNLFDYEGIHPLPPEMLWLPRWFPFGYGRAWCHSRVIAIPFSYFYGMRWQAPLQPLLTEIRSEIYLQPYKGIQWRHYRNELCNTDCYTPVSAFFKVIMKVLDVVEHTVLRSGWWKCFRQSAIETCWRHMAYDDENTHFICLGPVNKSLNYLATWIREGPRSTRVKLHKSRIPDYLYPGPCGMKMNGYNGSQLWDTSFAVQAICACRQEMFHPEEMQLAHYYINVAQVQEDPIDMDRFFRHRTKGAWNFSTSPQGWQVSDCTAEGLRVVLLLKQFNQVNHFTESRIVDAVEEILSLRNVGGDGGWASYEATRAPAYCELFNCAELFKDVMVEYSYAECSSSCIHSLSLFRKLYPQHRLRREVDRAIREGIACVLRKQRPDGSFYGSWAVCFTYSAWIVSDALRASGELEDMANHPHCQKMIHFLRQHQNADGGWGEDINACVRQVWVDNPDGSQVVNTAWAVMAIMCAAGDSNKLITTKTCLNSRENIKKAVENGIQFICYRQLTDGDWAQERISGVFNGNNPIHYPGYKNSMTVWALGMYNEWKKRYQ
ncbi:lanosterol synthase [Angomonas deanei]|uniref:Prenyltransferase and squalene oxidase repeat/Squalene-hopene cyclase N-terminal domain/Squalene-hopene cyclase C-terminal domain containing protein, putative n=1 Tax=Angomonas deanei TaxID=59799 RepID=A0A7G2CLW4_9TRYP|nr:lanosterol synthase [Angomonas deanei]CAD2220057.1 Prenyltransferase and squalene oxidase repeat/Squalene-hopene cyclase N-terminal domain/Squalene-hopene cyclase C-terminal domain containing protein, putative [Angomonas deanei]|eukprot:EPY42797.1 lanosterol synthase [Angomonas deanei]